MAQRKSPRKPALKRPAPKARAKASSTKAAAETWQDRADALALKLGLERDTILLRALDAFSAAHGLRTFAPPTEVVRTPPPDHAAPAPAAAETASEDEAPALAPAVRLYVHGNGRPPQEMIRDTYVIGSSNRADLWVNMPKIDTRHVKISREGTRYFLEDLGSDAGTVINGEKLKGRHELRHEDSIFLAGYHRVRFYLLA